MDRNGLDFTDLERCWPEQWPKWAETGPEWIEFDRDLPRRPMFGPCSVLFGPCSDHARPMLGPTSVHCGPPSVDAQPTLGPSRPTSDHVSPLRSSVGQFSSNVYLVSAHAGPFLSKSAHVRSMCAPPRAHALGMHWAWRLRRPPRQIDSDHTYPMLAMPNPARTNRNLAMRV